MFSLADFYGTKSAWHIKADGGEVVFSSVLEFTMEKTTALPSEPIEKGSFANYNRIIDPRIITVKLAKQGNLATLQSEIEKLEKMAIGFDKIKVITPENSYENMMLESFDYQRDSNNGNGLLIVDLRFKEVREVITGKTTTAVDEADVEDGSFADEVDGGEIQGQSPNANETGNGNGQQSSLLSDIFG